MTTGLSSEFATRFRSAAESYLEVIAQRRHQGVNAWLSSVHFAVLEVYAAAAALPPVVEPATTRGTKSAMSQEAWHALHQDIAAVLGRWDYYWDVFDPYDASDREPICNSLADDLADMFRDLQDGIDAKGARRPSDVLWQWRFDFESHWAAHATGALRALSSALFIHRASRSLVRRQIA